MVKGMDATLKSKGRSAKERATALRKMLNQMGVTPSSNSRRTSTPGGNEPASIRTGTAALDSFFGAMPSFGNNQQQQQRRK
jgi:hypothetical protein